jgi:colicin import membrane protein
LKIPIKVARRGEFSANLKLKAVGIAALDSMKEIDVDGKTTEASVELDLAQQKIQPGTYIFYLQTQTQGKYRRLPSMGLVTADEQVKAAEAAATQAEKHANDLAAEANKAKDALATAVKALEEAESAAKAFTEKLATAKQAASKDPQDEKLASAVTAAEKETAEAATKSKVAADAKAAAEKAVADASANTKEAETKKAAASARAKDITEKAKPKDVTATVYSAPIRLKVAAVEKAKSN